MLAFGYVLARAARGRERLSLLDWGGGPGHYAVLARALLPEVELEYHSRDLPALVALGRELLPRATPSTTTTRASSGRYDLVVASSSLQYSRGLAGDARRRSPARPAGISTSRASPSRSSARRSSCSSARTRTATRPSTWAGCSTATSCSSGPARRARARARAPPARAALGRRARRRRRSATAASSSARGSRRCGGDRGAAVSRESHPSHGERRDGEADALSGDGDGRVVRLTIPAKAEYILLGRLALTSLARLRPLSDEELTRPQARADRGLHELGPARLPRRAPASVEILYELHPDRLVVEVTDTGEGFDAARGRATTTRTSSPRAGSGSRSSARSPTSSRSASASGGGSRLRFVKLLSG